MIGGLKYGGYLRRRKVWVPDELGRIAEVKRMPPPCQGGFLCLALELFGGLPVVLFCCSVPCWHKRRNESSIPGPSRLPSLRRKSLPHLPSLQFRPVLSPVPNRTVESVRSPRSSSTCSSRRWFMTTSPRQPFALVCSADASKSTVKPR